MCVYSLYTCVYNVCVLVIHERNFVAPDDDMVHTQDIENTWMRAKQKLKRQFGTSRALFHTYLDEFMWKCSIESKNYFGKMLANIMESYSFQEFANELPQLLQALTDNFSLTISL